MHGNALAQCGRRYRFNFARTPPTPARSEWEQVCPATPVYPCKLGQLGREDILLTGVDEGVASYDRLQRFVEPRLNHLELR